MPSPREQALKIGVDRGKLESQTEDLPQNALPQQPSFGATPANPPDGKADVTNLKET